MRLSDFDFHLPEGNFALRPVEPRDAARLLVVQPGVPANLIDSRVRDLPGYLRAGDVMIFNDTRVIPARLHGIRTRDGVSAKIEIMLHKREDASRWTVFARPAKKLRAGDRLTFPGEDAANLSAAVLTKTEDGNVLIAFDLAGAALDAAIAIFGVLPLPPYIAQKRPTDARDITDYQTVYAREAGAVAAPTAGLHFTPEMLAELPHSFVTLHVGVGTFQPVKVDKIEEHQMHSERYIVSPETAERVQQAGRVVAVGTTAMRTLETVARDHDGTILPASGSTDIFIYPGFEFRAVGALLTNFHLPKSTLMMLVSAFAGKDLIMHAYQEAIRERYRFFSYGDCMLIL
jgi:S-adenosylmethionine:tRNA ribosyltransferase-isomerase